jgi:hypothetical protein
MSRLKTLLELRKIKFLRFHFFIIYFYIHQWKSLFFKQTLSPSIFVFAPCQQPVDPWFTLVDFLWTFFNRFFCFLFERIPLVMPTILHARTCVLHHCLPLLKPIHRCFLVSLEIFRPANLVLDVLLFCHPTSLFHILAQSYGSLLHFVWWHFDAGNTTFHSLLFVQLLLILLCRLAILVFDVPMFCQLYYCFVIHALSYG